MHYILLDPLEQIPGYSQFIDKQFPGYPINFTYDFDHEEYGYLGTFTTCKPDIELEMRVKHRKIDFDYYPARSNQFIEEYFISEELLNIIKTYKSTPFECRPVTFYGKNRKSVSKKKYYIISFINIPKYINRDKCLFVIPNGPDIYYRDLIEVSINYEILNKYDCLPSKLPTYPSSLVISENIINDKRMEKLNFKFISLEKAPLSLYKKEESNPSVDGLEKYLEKELDEMVELDYDNEE